MITKILFTIAIIVGVVLITRYSAQRRPAIPRYVATVNPRKPVRIAAYVVVGLIVASAALWLIMEWRDAHEVLTVRVVNSETGTEVVYDAFRSDIDKRTFRTVDGRRVTLADVERLEVMEPR